jgi:hypothetical protein
MSSGPWAVGIEDAIQPERNFNAGDRIVFNPPPGAYSRGSIQNQIAGWHGVVRNVVSDGYIIADFELWNCIILNSSFVEHEE